jgi:hypothetical protein
MSDDLFDGEIQTVKRTLLEVRDIQDPCVRWMRDRGWWARKFVSPNNRSVMDYVFGKDTWTEFVEFKAPDKTLTKAQKEEHKAARACGMRPVVFDNVEKFKAYIAEVDQYVAAGGGWLRLRSALARTHEPNCD